MKTRQPKAPILKNLNGAGVPDSENPQWTKRDFRTAKRIHQLPGAMQKDLHTLAKRGRPRKAAPKKQISLRLDAGLVDHLRRTGGYNTRVEAMLLKAWHQSRI